MAMPLLELLKRALDAYEAHLRSQPQLAKVTIGHRMRGAEHFALFLVGKTHKTERIKGTLSK